jgi:hypothetical protein
MTAPTTLWMRLTRRLGRDGNPLRRRSDLIEAWLAPTAIVVFLALCPLFVVVTGMTVRADYAAAQQAQQSWRPVKAVVLDAVPGPEMSDHGANTWLTWTPATWTVAGHEWIGEVPAPASTRADATVTAWLDRAGNVQLPPLTAAGARERVAYATLIALAALAVLLAVMTAIARRVLDRQRLAGWETAWVSVGPVWSRRQ